MKLFILEYFAKSDQGICSNDFKNKDQLVKINLNFVLSLSELEKFTLPLSGGYVDSYALLTMSNNDKYYIREKVFKKLGKAITS